jgi:acylphosphatase
MRRQAHITVRGIVQGVCFRAYTQDEARSLGLTGYVRNLRSGDVEIVAEGEDDQITRLIAWARRGPPLARVEDVAVTFAEPTGAFRDFSIRR